MWTPPAPSEASTHCDVSSSGARRRSSCCAAAWTGPSPSAVCWSGAARRRSVTATPGSRPGEIVAGTPGGGSAGGAGSGRRSDSPWSTTTNRVLLRGLPRYTAFSPLISAVSRKTRFARCSVWTASGWLSQRPAPTSSTSDTETLRVFSVTRP
ncbi:hypothetical protein GCM10007977_001320 [Dactylosporangium sucinum]|uniref:Uncharacterized protein n=1 Tax=Dactylosporangium sucinum TaxID=1424081 RepID=A0A917SYC9_9ACTN|nr:hypothetical protein GCM10007977_001320 [Dactylosporangium sucinum]